MDKDSFYWQKLPRPFTALAPMEDVTDTCFRRIIALYDKPDVMFTEFVSVEGINSAGRIKLLPKLKFTESEQPLIAQIWGATPDYFLKSAREINRMGFMGIDINLGCPQKKIIKTGGCAALIRNPDLTARIIKATRAGAGNLPLSVKTRLGYDRIEIDSWIGFLLNQKIDALTIHLRTVKEMSKVQAHWEIMPQIVKLRNKIAPSTILIGNGDIDNFLNGKAKCDKYGIEGMMIGRAAIRNFGVFKKNNYRFSRKEIIIIAINHLNLYQSTYGTQKNYATLKKFFKLYINNWKGAGILRTQLMNTGSISEALKLLNKLI